MLLAPKSQLNPGRLIASWINISTSLQMIR
jgi:hypothetical protein